MSQLSRRQFLKLLNRVFVASGMAVLLGPILAYFFPPKLEEMPAEPVLVGSLQELPVGGSKTVRFGRYPALVINTSDGLKAYSAVCTHFACIVKWDEALGQIVCPCHEGYFDPEDGHVISGPPPTPLESLEVQVTGDQIHVGGAS